MPAPAAPSPFGRVTVLGLGVLGAQIALQVAAHDVEVTAYDIDEAALAAGRQRLGGFAAAAAADLPDSGYADAPARIRLTSDLADAVREADLVIEAVPERLELKRDVWAAVGAAAPDATVFATNSSSLLPSAIADATGRPARFLALHFANHIWRQNTAEIMGSPDTDVVVADRVQEFAVAIGMVPIRLHKEQPGYVLNSLLMPFLSAAGELVVKGVADPETIDITWRKATGAPVGPFQIYDTVGLRTAYAIASANPRAAAWAAFLKEHYLDKGLLGRESGQGFYTYS